MQDFYVRRLGHSLYSADPESDECLTSLPVKGVLKVRILQPRNGRRLRLWWVICNRIGAGLGLPARTISDVLLVRTGHCYTVMTREGEERYPDSIAFDKCDEATFKETLDRAIVILQEQWGVRSEVIRKIVEDMEKEKA